MSASAAWPTLLNDKWQKKPQVINASISGDTSAQALARLPQLLTLHRPQWILVETGGNDGLRGFDPQSVQQNLGKIITLIKAAGAQPLLMQIRLPNNYGRRYNTLFSAIYPRLAQQYHIPLIRFFMEQVYLKPEWIQADGVHPTPDAQPFIADIMDKQLAPVVKSE